MTLTAGTEIYYGGDMANDEGFGVITECESNRWGDNCHIKMEDGREMQISPVMFSEEYKGHGGTRFVTKKAYMTWREAKFAAYLNE